MLVREYPDDQASKAHVQGALYLGSAVEYLWPPNEHGIGLPACGDPLLQLLHSVLEAQVPVNLVEPRALPKPV